ncbi:hypothetical protein EG328_000261 [Venturia inaequalis]|uniref:Thioesterase domain-containing protein n=1 Tax=Venturia inaequalis TaxID=5025 RepID=A0A8H3VLQ7_VENIN|nr:hypothetical protein EG328_000261 [Venturia inaequalis]KAE9989983.1 hypothetical protein EG327_001995 [Venturia inaequalis]
MVIHNPSILFERIKHKEYRIPQENLVELQKQEWCLETLNNECYRPIDLLIRPLAPHLAGLYTMMSKTLATKATIPIWEGFYKPFVSEEDPDEFRILLALGPDVDGHLNTAHGGVSALMLDEAMGNMALMHTEPGTPVFTTYMHTTYKKPVPTPSVLLLRATFDGKRSAGRKLYINASLESGTGVVYTTAEALFLEARGKDGPKI